MSINNVRKQEIIKNFSISERDNGSSGVQIAVLTEHINNLSKHMQYHKKDFHSRRGLLMLVSRRRKLLDYTKKRNNSYYKDLLHSLDIRR